jgi:hypothetical protein
MAAKLASNSSSKIIKIYRVFFVEVFGVKNAINVDLVEIAPWPGASLNKIQSKFMGNHFCRTAKFVQILSFEKMPCSWNESKGFRKINEIMNVFILFSSGPKRTNSSADCKSVDGTTNFSEGRAIGAIHFQRNKSATNYLYRDPIRVSLRVNSEIILQIFSRSFLLECSSPFIANPAQSMRIFTSLVSRTVSILNNNNIISIGGGGEDLEDEQNNIKTNQIDSMANCSSKSTISSLPVLVDSEWQRKENEVQILVQLQNAVFARVDMDTDGPDQSIRKPPFTFASLFNKPTLLCPRTQVKKIIMT